MLNKKEKNWIKKYKTANTDYAHANTELMKPLHDNSTKGKSIKVQVAE